MRYDVDVTEDPNPCETCEHRPECFGKEFSNPLRWEQAKACWVFEQWCETGQVLPDKKRIPSRGVYLRIYPEQENLNGKYKRSAS